MKLSLKNLKNALDVSTERRTVEDLKRSGTRSVRVITEEQVVRLIEAIVEDTLAESGHVDPAERDRVVAAAKARFDAAMQQQAETEARNKNQEETILSLQQRITQLVNEKLQLSQAQQKLEKQLDAAMRGTAPQVVVQQAPAPVDTRTPEELARLTEGLAQSQRQLEQKLDAALKSAAPVVVQPAAAPADTRTPEELNRLAEGLAQLQAKLDAALTAPAPVVVQSAAPAPAPASDEIARLAESLGQLQQQLSRLDSKGGAAGSDLDARMEQSMQKLIDRFGKTVANATAKPTEKRVEATDALIGRMLDGDKGTMSNIGDLDVQERRTKEDISKSLDRLRKAKKGPAAAPSPNGSPDQTTTDDRRVGPAERRADPQPEQDVKIDRREGSGDRRSP